jgi:hypothetical protein
MVGVGFGPGVLLAAFLRGGQTMGYRPQSGHSVEFRHEFAGFDFEDADFAGGHAGALRMATAADGDPNAIGRKD